MLKKHLKIKWNISFKIERGWTCSEFRRSIWKSKRNNCWTIRCSWYSSYINDLGADSLDIVELVMALEEEFDIEIPDADAEKVVTVGDVVDYIKENV